MESAYISKILFVLFAYLLGSVPTGIVVARVLGGVDPRKAGSGNIGATNVSRTSGKKAGALTLAGDVLKGALPPALAVLVSAGDAFVCGVALAAIAGHLFPVFLGFKGGKGVATACGAFLVLSPPALFLSMGVFILMVFITRYVSVGSMSAALSMPLFLFIVGAPRQYVVLGVVVAVLIIFKHSGNIKRLVEGRENRFR